MQVTKDLCNVDKMLEANSRRLVKNSCENIIWKSGEKIRKVKTFAIVHANGYLLNLGAGLESNESDADFDYNFRFGFNPNGTMFFERKNEADECEFRDLRYISNNYPPEEDEFYFIFVECKKHVEYFAVHGKYGNHHIHRYATGKEIGIALAEVAMLLPIFNSLVAKKVADYVKWGVAND